MNAFEALVAAELATAVRLGLPARGVRLTVRELVVTRIARGPLGPEEIRDVVRDTVRAACRLAHELDAPAELIDTVCRATLEAVRGHGGESARWLGEATSTVRALVIELAPEPVWSRGMFRGFPGDEWG